MGTLHAFNWADFVIIGIIVISTLISLVRGFVREILSLITWAVAFIVAFKFCNDVAAMFHSYISNSSARLALGFAILFFLVLIIGDIISHMIAKLATSSGIGGIDRTFGMVFGFLRGVLLVAVLLLLASLGSSTKDTWYQQSYLIPHFQGLVTWLHGFLPAKLANISHTASNLTAPVTKTVAQTANTVIPAD